LTFELLALGTRSFFDGMSILKNSRRHVVQRRQPTANTEVGRQQTLQAWKLANSRHGSRQTANMEVGRRQTWKLADGRHGSWQTADIEVGRHSKH